MARFVSRNNTISARVLKRKPTGSVVRHHSAWEAVKFVRVTGGWVRSRTDVTSERTEVVTSADVARECNTAVGCRESWARVY